jgi:hypothetical protein
MLAGGKRHHLDMEGKLWYKKSQFNTPEEINHLRSHKLRVPIASDMDRTLPFDQICPTYFKQTGGRTSANSVEERFQRREKKTERGRSITLKRNREY